MRFIFPFKEIDKNSRIILYGASEEGYDFYRQIVSSGYCDMVLWVDRQYEWWRTLKLPVVSPSEIGTVQYDLIVLTAENSVVADSMKEDLIKQGVNPSKIFWRKDCLIKGNIAASYDPDRFIRESEDAYEVSALRFLNENSLDIVIRIMYARDILSGERNELHEQMYRKLMMVQNGGQEPTDSMINAYFTEYSVKSGWNAFDQSLRELLDSMQQQGFLKSSFVPIDNKGRLINGRHRIAAAIALDKPVWVRKYPFDGINLCFDKKWLIDRGFSKQEISEIDTYYQIIKEKYVL